MLVLVGPRSLLELVQGTSKSDFSSGEGLVLGKHGVEKAPTERGCDSTDRGTYGRPDKSN
jgi:hypothetical protein